MHNLTARELKQTEWEHWDQWLALQPWGSPFSSAWWLDANCRAFGGYPLLLGIFDEEQLAGGIALRITDVGPVHIVRSSMLYNPIVIVGGSVQSRQDALGVLLEDLARRRLVVPSLSCTPDMVDLRQAVWHHWNVTTSWTVVTSLRTWVLEKDVSRAELKQMRKAQRADFAARVEPANADVLYDLMRASMSRQGQDMRLTREQLGTLLKAVGGRGMQTVVRGVDGIPLSAGFAVAHGTRAAYDVWAGTSPIGLEKGAAVARYICLLGELQARGYEYFDWCGANLPGVSDFKLEFGGTLTTYLAVSKRPLWFKMALAGYNHAKKIRDFLKRGEYDRQG